MLTVATHVHKKVAAKVSGRVKNLPSSPAVTDINQTGDIARLIPGNPIEDAGSGKNSGLDKQQSRLVSGASGISSLEVYTDSGEPMVSATFDGVNLSRIIASEVVRNPSEDAINDVTANISGGLDVLEEVLIGYGIEVDDIHADLQTWTYSFPLDEDDELNSWADVANQIEGEGGIAILNDFITMESENSLHDAVWKALGL